MWAGGLECVSSGPMMSKLPDRAGVDVVVAAPPPRIIDATEQIVQQQQVREVVDPFGEQLLPGLEPHFGHTIGLHGSPK